MTPLGDGVYEDDDGSLVLVVPELLKVANVRDTAENRQALVTAALDWLRDQGWTELVAVVE